MPMPRELVRWRPAPVTTQRPAHRAPTPPDTTPVWFAALLTVWAVCAVAMVYVVARMVGIHL